MRPYQTSKNLLELLLLRRELEFEALEEGKILCAEDMVEMTKLLEVMRFLPFLLPSF